MNLGIENAPGQKQEKSSTHLNSLYNLTFKEKNYSPVDFSHGDVNAFKPIPSSFNYFVEGFRVGSKQAYTEYRGSHSIRKDVANKLSRFTNTTIDGKKQLIITPGTQGALFLAMGSTISDGDKVAIVDPDYFAYRKLISFFGGEKVSVQMNYLENRKQTGLNFEQLESSFSSGVKLFVFSNPNNPVGVVYAHSEIQKIATLAEKYGVTVIVDQLYSRLIFKGHEYAHLCSEKNIHPDNLITIMGPSKTESLSGFRVGVAFGSSKIINRMEKLQAIVSLRASGYNQSVLKSWFSEPKEWIEKRIEDHQKIRDDIVNKFRANGFNVRTTEAGSYLFPRLPKLKIPLYDLVEILRSKAHVIVTPGPEFGGCFENSFRINFSQDYSESLKAIDRIIQIVEVFRIDKEV